MINKAIVSKRIVIIYSLLLALICIFSLSFIKGQDVYLIYTAFGAGGNVIYLNDNDLQITGKDKDGCSYFFLPAFVSSVELDQSLSEYKVFLSDGSLLQYPPINARIDINVDTGTGETVPWKISFLKSENLYTICLNTNDSTMESLTKDNYESIALSLISPDGDIVLDNEAVCIKGRGNSTWYGDKKPYEIKFDRSLSLCKMRPSKKWQLLANYFDSTKMYNKLAFDTADAIGMEYAIESDWIDLYVNKRYLGNYLLCKEPDIGKTDLNITSIKKTNDSFTSEVVNYDNGIIKGYLYTNEPPVLSGGYLISKETIDDYDKYPCGFKTDRYYFSVRSPNNASSNQVKYIDSFVKEVDSSLRNMNGDSLSMIDIESFSKRFLVEELFYNFDALVASYYYYKKPGKDVLYAGPVWDYDKSIGEVKGDFLNYEATILDQAYRFPDEWYKTPLDWDILLYENESYQASLRSVFRDNIPVFRNLIENRIDDCYEKIKYSRDMDYIVWGRGWYTGQYNDVYNNVRFTKFFLAKRLNWLCRRWDIDADFEYDFSDGTFHTVSYILPDGKIKSDSVPDGTQIPMELLPSYDDSIYSGWYYSDTHYPFSYYVPIFEDVTLELHTISEET